MHATLHLYTLRESCIKYSLVNRDLGLLVQSDLKWKTHYNSISTKAYRLSENFCETSAIVWLSTQATEDIIIVFEQHWSKKLMLQKNIDIYLLCFW